MNRGALLAASLLLNVLLLAVSAWFISRRSSPAVSQTPPPPLLPPQNPPSVPVNWTLVESPAYKKYLTALRHAGCPEDSIKLLVMSDVDKFIASKQTPAVPSGSFEYWKASSTLREVDDERLRQLAKLAQEKKALLKELLLIDIDDVGSQNEMLGSVAEMLGFLAKEKQLVVSEIEAAYASRTMRRFGGRISSAQWPEFKQVLDDKYEELARVLTPEELKEYDFRLSRVAQDVRNNLGEFEPTEKEFRTIVKIRKDFEDAFGSYLYSVPGEDSAARNKREAALLEMNRKLKEALGESRYADYEHEREYRTSSLRVLAEQHNIPKETIFQAFDVRQYAQEAALRIRSDPALSENQRRESLRKLRDESEKSFKNLLGTEAFEAYIRQSGRWLQNISPR